MIARHIAFHRPRGNIFRRLILAWILALIGMVVLAAPVKNLRFEQLGIEQGLPHELVQAILQDQQGFIWIGTQSGLARYDGMNILYYRADVNNPSSLRAPWVSALYQDKKGNLWVGTRGGGLARYNPAEESFVRYSNDTKDYSAPPGSKQILAIKGDGGNGMWLATMSGLWHFDIDSGKFTVLRHDAGQPASLLHDEVRDLALDSQGNLWVATPIGLDRLPKGSTVFEHYRLEDGAVADSNYNNYNNIRALLVDRNDGLWIGTSGGVELWSGDGGKRRFGVKDGLPPTVITAFYQDQDGTIWVGTLTDGLKCWDPDLRSFQSYRNQPGDPHSLADNRIVSLLQDRSGVLWAGTWNRGISRVDLLGGGFDRFVHLAGDPHSIGEGRLQGFAVADHDKIWIGTAENGLNRMDRRTGKVESFTHRPGDPSSISSNTVRAVQVNSQGVWVGSAGGLDLFNPVTGHFTHFTHDPNNPNSLFSNQIYTMYFDRQGILWIGMMEDGLDRFDPVTRTFSHYPHRAQDPGSLSPGWVVTIMEDSRNNLWVGTSTSGLNLFDRKTGRAVRFQHDEKDPTSLSQNTVTQVLEDHTGNLWVTTTGGLNRAYRDADGQMRFKHYTVKDGLENDVILDIQEDAKGYLWMGTNTGISRFDPVHESFRNFTSVNGLIDGTYMVGGTFKDQDGRMYFAGTRGLNIFDPNTIRDNDVLPQVVLTDFLIFNKSVRGASGLNAFSMDGSINHTGKVTMSYRYSVFSVEFAALHFADPLHNRYAYKLEGFDKNWVYTDANHRVATYTNLEPGKYLFRVKAATKEGHWNEQGTSLVIVITPPFWKTWWFRLLVAIVVLGSIYLAYRMRIRHFAQQQIRLEKLVLERTAEATAARAIAERKSTQISTLLDNSGQGFLSFAANLRVDPEYSLECYKIFDRSIEDMFVPELLYEEGKQRTYIEKNLTHVFRCGDDANRREIYMELLPTEYRLYGRDYDAKYRYLKDHRIMMILTDVSDAKALQERIEQERQRLDFLVNAMENRNDLLDTIQRWQQFRQDVLPALLLSDMSAEQLLIEIHREIHTYKGLFAQEGLPSMPGVLHTLEDALADLAEQDGIDKESLIWTLDQSDLTMPMEKDLALLREKLGAVYFAADKLIQIKVSALERIEQMVQALIDARIAVGTELAEALQDACSQPLSALLMPHFKAAAQLGNRLGKHIAPLRFEGDDVLVDPRLLLPFCKSLVHVFRNCVDHGVEDVETRLRAGKDEMGHIYCRLQRDGEQVVLCIGDDGYGMDSDDIRGRAVEKGLLSAAEAAALSDEQALRLIFMDGFSTRDQVTQISGRGIGLAATLQEIEKLGGSVVVVTQPGRGTEFRFSIPPQLIVGVAHQQWRYMHEFEQQ